MPRPSPPSPLPLAAEGTGVRAAGLIQSPRHPPRSPRPWRQPMQALDDIVVLDLTQHVSGPYATKLLADLGAEVIKVEPPWGDSARRLPPFAGDDPGLERSGLFAYLNTNKRSVVLDLRAADGREGLRRLAGRADVVVESF